MAEQTDQLTSTEPAGDQNAPRVPNLFLLRSLVVAGIIVFFIWYFNFNIGSIGQGLAYSLVGVSLFITFRILH